MNIILYHIKQDLASLISDNISSHIEQTDIHIHQISNKNDINNNYDVAFIDIDEEGMNLAKEIMISNPSCFLFFIGNNHQYLQLAFLLKAFQYLILPIHPSFLKKEINRMMIAYHQRHFKFLFHTDQGTIIFRTKDIIYVETYYHQIKIVTQEHIYYSDIKQKETLLSLFKTLSFIKVQRSYTVNMKHIIQLTHDSILLTNGEKIHTPSAKKEHIITKYNQFLIHEKDL